uniref:Putative juvenile hormone binding protein n=1 Tax=Culex quinquefasciatus TaxID=7176 RepID=A0A1V0CLZ4_CULQU|nr:putative juvenile hormone binding protein [Culex quinquefasciatus]
MNSKVTAVLASLALQTVLVWPAAVPGCPEEPSPPPVSADPSPWTARNPEQTMYAYVRCLNDSTASVEQKIRWVRWQPDASTESQCYVKCVSEELQLFDVRERRFRPERFVLQAESYGRGDVNGELDKLRTNAEPMLAGSLEEATCEAVFNKYATFYTTHTETILRMFHGDHRDLVETYGKLGDKVKQIGETFVAYCEKRYEGSWGEDEACPATALVDCVLRGFRWITEEGDVNVNEIRRDYAAAWFGDSGEASCQNASGARELFHCLREASPASLNQVIRERNQRTAFYFDAASQEEPWRSAVEFGQQRMQL